MELQTSNAVRAQRFRKRRREGLSVFQIELDETALADELEASGYLHPFEHDDRTAVAHALQRAVMFLIFGKKELEP